MAENESRKSDKELDVSLETPKKKGGCGWGSVIAIFLIIAMAVVVILGVARYEKKQAEKEQRAAARQAQLNLLGSELIGEIAKVQAGDLTSGISGLKKASSTLSNMISDAQTTGDKEDVDILQQRKQTVDKAMANVAKEQETMTKLLTDELQATGASMGGSESKRALAAKAASAGAPAKPAAAAAPLAPATPPASAMPAPPPAPPVAARPAPGPAAAPPPAAPPAPH